MSCQFCGHTALTEASHPQAVRPVLLCGNLVCRAEFRMTKSQLIGAPPKRSMAETAAFEGAEDEERSRRPTDMPSIDQMALTSDLAVELMRLEGLIDALGAQSVYQRRAQRLDADQTQMFLDQANALMSKLEKMLDKRDGNASIDAPLSATNSTAVLSSSRP